MPIVIILSYLRYQADIADSSTCVQSNAYRHRLRLYIELRPIYLKRRNVIQHHTIAIIDKCEYRLLRIIRSYGNS